MGHERRVVQPTAITDDPDDVRALAQPRGAFHQAIRQQIEHSMALQVDEDRPEAMAPAPGPFVDAHVPGRRFRRRRDRADDGAQRGAPHRQAEGGEWRAPAAPPRVTLDDVRKALGEDAPQAGRVPAEEASHLHPQSHGQAVPRHISDRAHVAAIDRRGDRLTCRAAGCPIGGDPERNPLRRRRLFVKAQAREMGEEYRQLHWLLQAGATTAQTASVAPNVVDDIHGSSKAGKTPQGGHMWGIEVANLLNMSDTARDWMADCIIRAKLLDKIREAFAATPDVPNLLVDPGFATPSMGSRHTGGRWSKRPEQLGIACPATSASPDYVDSYRSARLPANLIQAQRDFFGAHTYKRTDKNGTFHTQWDG